MQIIPPIYKYHLPTILLATLPPIYTYQIRSKLFEHPRFSTLWRNIFKICVWIYMSYWIYMSFVFLNLYVLLNLYVFCIFEILMEINISLNIILKLLAAQHYVLRKRDTDTPVFGPPLLMTWTSKASTLLMTFWRSYFILHHCWWRIFSKNWIKSFIPNVFQNNSILYQLSLFSFIYIS